MFTLNCKGKIIVIEQPLVMAIVNATPDSFYKGYLAKPKEELFNLITKMVAEGADIIDVGGQSTRPGSERIDADEEIKRAVPVIEWIQKNFPEVIISIDTYSSKVAAVAVDAGAVIVNDISSGDLDLNMLPTVATLKVPYICMHMQGRPETMQTSPKYENVVREILDYFIAKTEQCKQAGITDVIIDPGFGFGKTAEDNFSLLKNLNAFTILNKPVLAGLSRKSMICKTLQTSADEALNGTTVLNTTALLNGASILRVHDVKEAKEAITLFTKYKNAP